jgi:hypothetical protein
MTAGGGSGEEGELAALAASFVVPAKSGVYITKNEIIALARASEASLRVNERRRMLGDVLKSAQTLVELRAMIGRMADFCRLQLGEYEAMVSEHPRSAELLAPWMARARATVARLEEIDQELGRTRAAD